MQSDVFIAKASRYGLDFAKIIQQGLLELGITEDRIKGKRILLKPNVVETHPGKVHINTHPLVIRGAAEAFLAMGAAAVTVAEGPGHCSDTLLLLEESGLSQVLVEDRIQFIDLNYEPAFSVPNSGGYSFLKKLMFPYALKKTDWIVSMPKMKTHHWAGVTLSMKNMFGILPGSYYGWPKNVLHAAGIHRSILDIYATLKPQLAIVDGVIGMEGDGPIMGTPKYAGVLVIGENFPAVDATCARIMKIDPTKIPYLKESEGWLGPIRNRHIHQRGELIDTVKTEFQLLNKISAHKLIRLKN
jgi:uncharacterized protein (DUF362 family)